MFTSLPGLRTVVWLAVVAWMATGCTPIPVAGMSAPQAGSVPTTINAEPTTVARALESDVSLGLGSRDFTMTVVRADGTASEKIRCQAFTYDVKSPRDVATGQSSGKRQHKPIMIVKEWDAASPMLLSVLVSNETLKSVKLEFSRNKVDSPRFFDVFTEITLTGASVVGLTHVVGDASRRCPDDVCLGGEGPRELEEISLTCVKATLTSIDGKTTAEDSWVSPR